ncbi:retinol dehydrogenase [Mycobacterium lehmannii]|uniref:Retinol dehydrogenase n=1 Tax=Mycobacterium lehmannii TaxID=2048550 RepID=A0A101AA57_9MYCO|nr:SDR family NAD(P)-dependent oxidoreductase [Mycobacterium lehmannii]KUI18912.1 retinol dehydrogenase [Mycobacterium lehmannii]
MPSVLVTGASRGIGRAIAEHLAARGWQVIAGVRTETDAVAVTALDPHRISAVLLDVTDAGQIAALAHVLPARLDAVVNNAGVVVSGPMEAVTSDEWRKQLEINVIGQLAVTRAVLPRMREAHGRIVFISSVNGRVSMPLLGAYAASKFALEAALSPEHRALYAEHIAGMKKMVPVAQRMAVPTEKVSAVVEEALTARRPRPRYVVGLAPKLQVAVVLKLPTRVRDAVLRRVSGQP